MWVYSPWCLQRRAPNVQTPSVQLENSIITPYSYFLKHNTQASMSCTFWLERQRSAGMVITAFPRSPIIQNRLSLNPSLTKTQVSLWRTLCTFWPQEPESKLISWAVVPAPPNVPGHEIGFSNGQGAIRVEVAVLNVADIVYSILSHSKKALVVSSMKEYVYMQTRNQVTGENRATQKVAQYTWVGQ